LLLGSIGLADSVAKPGGTSAGDVHEGVMHIPLVWSAALQPESVSLAVPGNCEGSIDMDLRWSEEDDTVKLHLKGKHVLDPHPTVTRTQGVDFFPNPFWPEAQSFTNGRYQFWFISPSEEILFYYDAATLNLLGTEVDFPTQPPNSIPISIPTVKVLGSDFIHPDENGDVDVHFTWAYHGLVRLDRPELSHMIVSFPPHNLCESNPFRYDLSHTRGYISKPRPAAEARPFSAYLKNGFIIQITVEPPQYFVDPPRDTQTATYNNVTNIPGLVPKGYIFDIDAMFSNVAPGIKPFFGAGHCQDTFSGVHTKNLNFCGP
jgi:hypothetical protein